MNQCNRIGVSPCKKETQFRRLLCVVLLSVVLSSHANPNEVLRLAYPGHEEGMWGRLAVDLAEDAADRNLTLEHYPLIDLGGNQLAVELVRNGLVDIAAVNGIILAKEIESFEVLNLPFLAVNLNEARAIVTAIGPALEGRANAKGLHVLGYTWVIGTFVSSGNCVLAYQDILGARVMDGPPRHQDLFQLAGASSVAISASDVYSAMERGLSSTGLFTVEFVLSANLPEVTDCLTNPEDIAVVMLPIVMVANLDRWIAIGEEKTSMLAALVKETEQRADRIMEEMVTGAVEMYINAGRSSVKMEADVLTEWRNLARPLYDGFRGEIEGGDVLLDEAIEARKKDR
jgi:TRAP-type C4-dicarboxylate transport system substrate-binding protein